MTTSSPTPGRNRWPRAGTANAATPSAAGPTPWSPTIRGRAVCFTSGEPSGLTRTLPGALAELRRVVGADAPILLGFDRGGSYPVTFSHCRDAGVDWVSYRRGPLAATGAAPAPVAVVRAGTTQTLSLADEYRRAGRLRPGPPAHLSTNTTPRPCKS